VAGSSPFVVSVVIKADGTSFDVIGAGAKRAATAVGGAGKSLADLANDAARLTTSIAGTEARLSAAQQELGQLAAAGKNASKEYQNQERLVASLSGKMEAYRATLQSATDLSLRHAGALREELAAEQAEAGGAAKLRAERELVNRAVSAGFDPATKLGQAYLANLRVEIELTSATARLESENEKLAASERTLHDSVAKTTAELVQGNASLSRRLASYAHGPAAVAKQRQEEEILNRVIASGVKLGSEQAVVLEREIRERLRLTAAIEKQEASSRQAAHASSSGGGLGIGGLVAGLAAYVSVGSVIHSLIEEVGEGEKAFAQLSAGVKSTGGAAGYTATQLVSMAEGFSSLTGIDDEVIQGAESLLLTFTKIGHDVFPQAQQAVLDLSTRLEGDLKTSAIQVGKALNDPIAGITALKKVGISFSEEQKRTIKAFVETGQIAKAQGVILQELAVEVGGSAAAFRNTLPGALSALKVSWGNLLQDLGDGDIGNLIRSMVERAIRALDSEEFRERGKKVAAVLVDVFTGLAKLIEPVSAVLLILIDHLEAVKILLESYAVLRVAQTLNAIALGFRAMALNAEVARTSVLGLNRALLVNPITWVPLALLGLNHFVESLRDADANNTQLNIGLANQVGAVGELRKAYGELEQQQIDAAKAGIDALSARRTQIEQEKQALLTQAGYSQEGASSPSFRPSPEVLRLDEAARDHLLKQIGVLSEEEKNLDNVLAHLTPRLEEHQKHVKGIASASDDAATSTGRLSQDLERLRKAALDAVAAAQLELRNIEAQVQARGRGVEALKLEITLQEALAKARAAGAGATSAQRLELVRLTFSIAAAKDALARMNEADAEAGRLFKVNEEFLDSYLATLKQLANVTASFQGDLLAKLREQNVEGTQEMTATVRDTMGRLREEAALLAADLKAPWVQLGTTIRDSILDNVAAAVTGSKVQWKDMWQSFLQQAVRAIAEWVRVFIAAVIRAKAAQSVLGEGGSPGGGSSGGTGWISAARSVWGTYRGAQTAQSGYGYLYGNTAAAGSRGASAAALDSAAGGGSTAGAGASSSGISTGALAGIGATVAIFAAVYFLAKNWIDHHKREFEQFRVGASGSGSLTWSLGSASTGIQHLGDVADGMVKTVTGIIRGLGGIMQGWTGDLTVSRSGHGKHTEYWVQYADGLIRHFGNDAEAAFQFATIQAVKQSRIGGLPAEVRDAISKSAAETADQFQGELDKAFARVATRLGTVGSQVYDIFTKFGLNIDDEIRKALGDLKSRIADSQTLRGGGVIIRDPFVGGRGAGDGEPTGDPVGGLPYKGGGRLSVESALEEVRAVSDLVAARNREVEAVRNSLLGVDDSSAKRLADLASFNRGVEEARGLITAQIELVQEQLASLSGKTGESADRLRAVLTGYLDQLNRVPEAISGAQLNGAIFDTLYKYLEGSAKYAKQAHEYALLKVEIEFAAIKAQLLALDKWAEFGEMFNDAYAAAREAAGKPAGGRGSGRQDARKGALDHLDDLRHANDSDAMRIYRESQKAQSDWNKEAKEGHLTQAQLAEGERLIADQRKKALRDQAESLAGIGTDFTRQLATGMAFFADLKKLGRKETGIPDWLRDFMEGKFLDKMKASWAQGVMQLAGISDPFAQIDAQTAELRENLVELAKASGMSAAEVLAASVALDHAADMAKRAATYQLEDRLFEPLKDLPEWQGKIVELKKQEVELQYEILKAELIAAGLWEKDKDVWQASHDAAVAVANGTARAAQSVADLVDYVAQRNIEQAEALANAQRQAAISFTDLVRNLVDSNRRILTGAQSPLGPQERFQTALADYQRTLAAAQGGNSEALGNLVGIRDTLLQVAQSYFAGGAGEGLSGGFAQLVQQTLADFANLAVSPAVEAATLQDLVRRQSTIATDAAAQAHADLISLRQAVIDLNANNGVGNLYGGSNRFASAPAAPVDRFSAGAPVAPVVPFPVRGGDSSENEDVVRELRSLRQEVAALRRERSADAQKEIADLDVIAEDAADAKRARARAR